MLSRLSVVNRGQGPGQGLSERHEAETGRPLVTPRSLRGHGFETDVFQGVKCISSVATKFMDLALQTKHKKQGDEEDFRPSVYSVQALLFERHEMSESSSLLVDCERILSCLRRSLRTTPNLAIQN